MSSEEKQGRESSPFYQMPARIGAMEDALISLGPLSLTLRQCFILVIGGCIIIDLWRLDLWNVFGPFGVIIRGIGIGMVILLTILDAFLQIANRSLESWLLVLYRYWQIPKIYLWHPVPRTPISPARASRTPQQANEQEEN